METVEEAVLHILKSHNIDLDLADIINNSVNVHEIHKCGNYPEEYFLGILSEKVLPSSIAVFDMQDKKYVESIRKCNSENMVRMHNFSNENSGKIFSLPLQGLEMYYHIIIVVDSRDCQGKTCNKSVYFTLADCYTFNGKHKISIEKCGYTSRICKKVIGSVIGFFEGKATV